MHPQLGDASRAGTAQVGRCSPAQHLGAAQRLHLRVRIEPSMAVAALVDGVGLGAEDIVRRDLADIVGTWIEEAAVEAALSAQDGVDEGLWK